METRWRLFEPCNYQPLNELLGNWRPPGLFGRELAWGLSKLDTKHLVSIYRGHANRCIVDPLASCGVELFRASTLLRSMARG
jgi:hypothetical protein